MVRAMLGAAPAPKPPMDRSKSFVTKEEAAQVKVTRVETAATILGLAKNKSNRVLPSWSGRGAWVSPCVLVVAELVKLASAYTYIYVCVCVCVYACV